MSMSRRLARIALGLVFAAVLASCVEDNGGAIDVPSLSTSTAPGGAVLTYYVTMDGAAERPPGDPDGRGTATITIDTNEAEACLDLSTEGLAQITGVHIHTGDESTNGSVIVPFAAPTEAASNSCAPITAEAAQAVEANPEAHYLNVHTVEHPDGAIRGQLG